MSETAASWRRMANTRWTVTYVIDGLTDARINDRNRPHRMHKMGFKLFDYSEWPAPIIRTVARVLVSDTARCWLTSKDRLVYKAGAIPVRVVDGARGRRVGTVASTRPRVDVDQRHPAGVPVSTFNLMQPALWIDTTQRFSKLCRLSERVREWGNA